MIADDFSGMTASTSNETRRLLTIEIEQNGRIIATLKVNDGSTIGNLFSFLNQFSYCFVIKSICS